MKPQYREEPCRTALNRVRGMGFSWSLNRYMGRAHRCTFCYVRAYELCADRPSGERYGRSIRVNVGASVGMAPILPGISDAPDQLEAVVRAAREAGATGVWTNLLYLNPGTREHFLQALARDWPQELDRYQRLYASRAYLPKGQTAPVQQLVAGLRRKHGVRDRRRVRLEPEPAPEQLAFSLSPARSR